MGKWRARKLLTETAPNVAIGLIDFEDSAQVLDSCREGVFGAQDACDTLHSWHRPLVELQGLFVALHGTVVVLHLLREGACWVSVCSLGAHNGCMLTHLSPHSLGQLPQVLRRCLGLCRVRWVTIDLRVGGMLAYMMWRHARGGRRLLVLCHEGCLRPIWLQCDVCATEAATVTE
jgi:hypothetical protein